MASPRLAAGGRLVGRQVELAVVQQQIELVLGGTGRTLLLSGEAGVGKTRLVDEIKTRFSDCAPRVRTLTGHSFEPDRGIPYAPILDAVRSLPAYREATDLERLFAHDIGTFVRLLPELHIRYPKVSPIGVLTPEQEKARLFRALVGLFDRQSREVPLLLVIEDLQWSDESSLEFLIHLARAIEATPTLLICTYRAEEEHSGLRRTLVEFDRLHAGLELRLTELSIGDVDIMLRGMFNQPYSIRSDFLHAIYQLTEGNPLYIEEVVRSLIAAGDIYQTGGRWTRKDLQQIRIPRSVQDAVARRTEHLDARVLRVLEHAAIIGQRFEFSLLERLTGLAEAELLDLVRALVDARLVVDETADQFRFHHALIRESVYEGLLARERRTRHGRVAEALEELHRDMPEPWLADLVYHFHAAEHWEKTLAYAAEAGERARSLFAPQAAIEHFTRALEALGHLGRIPPPELPRRRGDAYEVLGEFELARSDYDAALQIARANGDLHGEWEVLIALGRSWEGLSYARAGSWFECALKLARRLDDPVALAHNLNRVGNWYCNTERVDEARAAHLEALSIFEELGDEPGIAATFDYLGTVADNTGDLVEMRARYEQAIAMFERLGDLQHLSSTLASMASLRAAVVCDVVAVPPGTTVTEAIHWGTRGLQLARETNWRAGEVYALMTLSLVHIATADYGPAFALTTEGLEIAREIKHREWLCIGYAELGSLYRDILAHDLAVEHLEQSSDLARASGSLWFQRLSSSLLVDTLIEYRRLERAKEILKSFPADIAPRTVGQRWVWFAHASCALADDSAEEALEILDYLFATHPRTANQQDIPLLAWRRARALLQLGRLAEAEDALLAARAGSAALDQLGKLWRINLDLASLYREFGRPKDSAQALQAAQAIIERIAPGIPDESLREGFQSEALRLLDEVRGDHGTRRPKAYVAGLTPREMDVALLVARGLSNRQIADELSIGERTVETHVSNTLAKLEFASRAQIAAWIVEHRLARIAGDPPSAVRNS